MIKNTKLVATKNNISSPILYDGEEYRVNVGTVGQEIQECRKDLLKLLQWITKKGFVVTHEKPDNQE